MNRVLSFQNVWKTYRYYANPADRARDWFHVNRRQPQEFVALREIDLDVQPGQTLGIVGPNGSGKSTLLQIASGILQPTRGRVQMRGRVAAILELGTGFNPEFTGKENVYLTSEILGVSRAQVDREFESIAAFAGVGAFMDRPVKEYSSGMYVRLAFSAAIHVHPEILIVDEALAVGDAVFANRCIRKLHQLRAAGTTILFVTHDLGLLKQIADSAVLLLQGRLVSRGSVAEVANQYVAYVREQEAPSDRSEPSSQFSSANTESRASVIRQVDLLNSVGTPVNEFQAGETIRIRLIVEFCQYVQDPTIGMLIRNRQGLEVFGTNTLLERLSLGEFTPGETLSLEFRLPCVLTCQEYSLTVATQYANGQSQDWRDDILAFRVVAGRHAAGVIDVPVSVSWQRQPDPVLTSPSLP